MRRLRRRLAGLILVAGVALVGHVVGAGTAQAAVAAVPSLTLSPTSGPPGAVITVKGTQFGGLERVDLFLDTTKLRSTAVDSQGAFSAPATLPVTATSGTHQVRSVGRTSHRTAQAPFVVVPPAAADWPQFGGGPGHAGFNPGERTIGASNVATVRPTRSVGSDVPPEVVVGTTGYGVTHGTLTAFDLLTGATRWTSQQGTGYRNGPAVGGGRVFVGAFDGHLYALDAASGAPLWDRTVDVNPLFSAPTVAGDTVYVHGDNHADQTIWYALDAATGAIRWQTAPAPAGVVRPGPAVADGRVYVFGVGQQTLSALDTATGAIRWTVPMPLAFPVDALVAVDGVLYVAARNLYAFDAATGRALWTRRSTPVPGDSRQFGLPSVANGTLYSTEWYFGADPVLHAVNTTDGSDRWTVPGVSGTPTIANGLIYLGGSKLRGLAAATGAPLWTWTPPAPATSVSTPIVANGRLVARTAVGETTDHVVVLGVG